MLVETQRAAAGEGQSDESMVWPNEGRHATLIVADVTALAIALASDWSVRGAGQHDRLRRGIVRWRGRRPFAILVRRAGEFRKGHRVHYSWRSADRPERIRLGLLALKEWASPKQFALLMSVMGPSGESLSLDGTGFGWSAGLDSYFRYPVVDNGLWSVDLEVGPVASLDIEIRPWGNRKLSPVDCFGPLAVQYDCGRVQTDFVMGRAA